MSKLEDLLARHMQLCKMPEPKKEYRFHPDRRWRFDFAFPDIKLAVEVEGGTWNGGRHTRGSGFAADCEKYNEAVLLGWRVLRFDSKAVTSGQAVSTILNALGWES